MVLEDRAADIFSDGPIPSPYMLFVHRVDPGWVDRIPAAVHVDGTARIQTVDPAAQPRLGATLREFEQRTGLPVVINTSLNTAGRPMVDDPRDALEPVRLGTGGPAGARPAPGAAVGGVRAARRRSTGVSGDGTPPAFDGPTVHPAWAVVIPTVGRPSLHALLTDLAAQVFAGDAPAQVVVVDDRPLADDVPLALPGPAGQPARTGAAPHRWPRAGRRPQRRLAHRPHRLGAVPGRRRAAARRLGRGVPGGPAVRR